MVPGDVYADIGLREGQVRPTCLPRLHLVQVPGLHILARRPWGGLWEEVQVSLKDLPPHRVILDVVVASLEERRLWRRDATVSLGSARACSPGSIAGPSLGGLVLGVA